MDLGSAGNLPGPLVVHYHSAEPGRTGGGSATIQKIERLAAQKADLIVTVSYAMRDELVKLGYPEGKIRVVYNGVAEASTVPPSWHGWLHHTGDGPPTQGKGGPRPWWKPHRANMTGTPGAHRPTGSTLAQGRRPKATGDYKAWTPGR